MKKSYFFCNNSKKLEPSTTRIIRKDWSLCHRDRSLSNPDSERLEPYIFGEIRAFNSERLEHPLIQDQKVKLALKSPQLPLLKVRVCILRSGHTARFTNANKKDRRRKVQSSIFITVFPAIPSQLSAAVRTASFGAKKKQFIH